MLETLAPPLAPSPAVAPARPRRNDLTLDHVGVFGRRLSGKTTLVKELVREYWRRDGWRAIVLDIHLEHWGEHAWLTADREAWLRKVWESRRCNVVCDEAVSTIHRDRSLSPLFTRIGHCEHRLFVMGHNSAALLPVMREQLTELFLFRQSRHEAELWAELFTDDALLRACDLDFTAREFLHARLGRLVEVGALKLPRR